MSGSGIASSLRAFVRVGYLETISYPLSSVISQTGTVVALVSTFFLSHLVRQGGTVGGSYLTFVLLGMIGQMAVNGAFSGIGMALDHTIQQGRLETVLVEPIRWPLVPAALGVWPSATQLVQICLAVAVGLALGVRLLAHGAPATVLLVALGLTSGLVMGVLSASVRVLAKRSDPVWLVYSIASGLVCGVGLPINLLPLPLRALSWLFPTTYVVAGVRKALMPHPGGVYGAGVTTDLLALFAFTVVGGCVAMWVFARSLDAGRRLGVLAGY